ncbi:MAG TPA: TetR/AcrR family transcriptional regulator [Spirochaetota bacterium]|nr:TetR/AcrR family transcriptional regulator [Spirochaetota bacterium]
MNKGQITRDKVIQLSMDLIHARGVGNTSMNDIIAATGVKKGNLYFHFSSKEELALEVIDRARRQYSEYLSSAISGTTSMEKLESLIDAVVSFHVKRKLRGGCIFGNTALETGGTDSPLRLLIREVFSRWAGQIEALIIQAAGEGSARNDIPPDVLARTIIAALEGAIMLAKVSGKKDELIQCADAMKAMIKTRQ